MNMEEILHNKTFAIVGNSPKEKGTNNGAQIDSHDIVFRFNNFDTGSEFAADYGTKANIWVCSFCRDIKERNEAFDEILCPLPLQDDHYRRRYGNTNTEMLLKTNPRYIPVSYFSELLASVPNPSTGLAFLYWIFKTTGKIDSKDVFGFSFFDKEIGHHYFDEDSRCGHAGDLEKDFAQRILF